MPRFYGMEKLLIDHLETMHYTVDWIENKTLPFDYQGPDSKMRFLRKLLFTIFMFKPRYIKKQLKNNNPHYNVLLSINCHVISSFLFKELKKQNRNLYSVLYLWDSSKMYNCVKSTRLFDRIFTFDPYDANRYKWTYLPNFYINTHFDTSLKIKHDIFFAGKFTTERFRIFEKINDQINKSEINKYFKILPSYKNSIHNKYLYLVFKNIRPGSKWLEKYILNYEAVMGYIDRDYLISKAIEPTVILKELKQSNVILDLPFAEQRGYSHRLIAALALGKKIISSNYLIRSEKFYNPDQIKIIDPENPALDLQWVKKYRSYPADRQFKELELSEWLQTMLTNEVN